MPNPIFPAALVVASLAISSTALAEDARVTCIGTVSSIDNGGVAPQPFASAAVGDAVTLTIDVEILSQQGQGDDHYQINSPTSSVAIGAASDRPIFTVLNEFALRDNPQGLPLDTLSLIAWFGNGHSANLSIQLFHQSGLAWNSSDVRQLYGTNLMTIPGLESVVQLSSSQGTLRMDLTSMEINAAPGSAIGTSFCTAVPNSTGAVGTISAFGLLTPGDNDFTLTASGLPPQTNGFFLVSSNQGFVAGPGGSSGNLCLSGSIGRFLGPFQPRRSSTNGEASLPIELTILPGPTGSRPVQSGETWNFQYWHRDTTPAGTNSNFTQALAVTFQ